MATSTLATEACKKAYKPPAVENNLLFDTFLLKHVLCINQTVHFKKDQVDIQAILNSVSKINAMTPIYAAKLDFKI